MKVKLPHSEVIRVEFPEGLNLVVTRPNLKDTSIEVLNQHLKAMDLGFIEGYTKEHAERG